jgi:hypothetical protein
MPVVPQLAQDCGLKAAPDPRRLQTHKPIKPSRLTMQTFRAKRVLSRERRGSSCPVVIETDQGSRLFTKLRGAAQGTSALVAEIIVAALAEAIGLRVPARSLVLIDDQMTSEDHNDELADLLVRSQGYNLGFQLLEGAQDFRPAHLDRISSDAASRIVWLDGLVMNPDRTAKNPNLMMLRNEPWLIDHGATLGFQHNWASVTEDSPRRLTSSLRTNVLLERATELAELDEVLAQELSREVLRAAVGEVPDDFLEPLLSRAATCEALARRREAYVAFLWKRLKPPRPFVQAASLAPADCNNVPRSM